MRDGTYYRFTDAFILLQIPYDAGIAILNLAAPKFNNATGKDVLHVLERHSTELRDIMTKSDSESGRKQEHWSR